MMTLGSPFLHTARTCTASLWSEGLYSCYLPDSHSCVSGLVARQHRPVYLTLVAVIGDDRKELRRKKEKAKAQEREKSGDREEKVPSSKDKDRDRDRDRDKDKDRRSKTSSLSSSSNGQASSSTLPPSTSSGTSSKSGNVAC